MVRVRVVALFVVLLLIVVLAPPALPGGDLGGVDSSEQLVEHVH
jgi:hypothetical protein